MAADILKMIPGEKRYYAVEFSAQEEVVNGETLTGTPTVAFDTATALTITLVTISGTQVRFWVESTTAAATGTRKATVTVTTSGGATLKEVCSLKLVTQF